jgi:hypothetical protein
MAPSRKKLHRKDFFSYPYLISEKVAYRPLELGRPRLIINPVLILIGTKFSFIKVVMSPLQ